MEASFFPETCGFIASCLTLVYYAKMAVPFIRLIEGKVNFEETPGFYACITYVNCLCWYIYGDFLYSDKIKYIYLIGAIINFIFVFIYLYYEIRKYKQDAILNGLIILSGTYMIYVGLTIVIDNVDVIAKICFASYSILFLFPMHVIYIVIRYKNYYVIPLYSCCGTVITSLCWAIYGYGITESFVIYPHAIIVILYAILIFIHLNYKRRYPIAIKKKTVSTIGIDNNENENEEIKKDETENENENNHKMDEETQPSLKEEKPVKIVEKMDN
jgi:hypothetical protein